MVPQDGAVELTSDAVYLLAGMALLLGAVLPRLLRHRALSTPMAFLGAGLLAGLLPLPATVDIAPAANRRLTELLSELCVVVALMGVGLAIDRRLTWRGWATTRRLLLVAMPLTIAGVAVLGWWVAGLVPASALLLGAALAPTDPVLASDVQVDGPDVQTEGDPDELDEDDEVRFALTSEAGLNDGAAFPFVYAAILLATEPAVGQWALRWLGWDLLGRVLIGAAVGWGAGWVLGRLAFSSSRASLRFADAGEPIVAIAATLGVYGLTEVLGGYGFLAVFLCGVALRSRERGHEFHASLHEFLGQLEHMLTWMLLLLIGVSISHGLLASLTWGGAMVSVLLLLVVRPLAAWMSLYRSGLGPLERRATAFFGVRGIGSVYYLAYATGQADFVGRDGLWSVVGLTIALSVVLHGITATPVMRRLEDRRAGSGTSRPS